MDDRIIETRKMKFKPTSINILESREQNRLTLRKQHLEDLIYNKRQKYRNSNDLEINPFLLELPKDLLEKTCQSEEELIKFLSFLLKSQDINYNKLGIIYCRKLLAPKDKIKRIPVKLFVDNSFLDIFLEYLQKSDDIQIIYEILWCLLNILSVRHGSESHFYNSNEMIKIYLKFLENDKIEIIEEVLKIIGNLINDSQESKEIIISSGIFDKIIQISRNNYISEEIIIDIIWILYSLFKKQHSGYYYNIPEEIVIYVFTQGLSCLNTILTFIYYDNKDIKIECLNGLTILAEYASLGVVRKMVEHEVIKMMINSKSTLEDDNFKLAILRVIGNLTGNTEETVIKDLISFGLIDFLDFYILDNYLIVRREVAWIISNLVADTREALIEVIKRGELMGKIILLIKQNEFTTGYSEEAVHCLCNACLGCDETLFETYLIQYKIFELLVFCLANFSRNLKTLELVIVTIHYILVDIGSNKDSKEYIDKFEELGGISYLENLSNHNNIQISKKVLMILDEIKTPYMKY